MPTINDLMNAPRFNSISTATKTSIISSIGLDINTAAEETVEKKFTHAELCQALHYLIAKHAKSNVMLQRLVQRGNSNSSASYSVNPFYFPDNDPFLWYWLGAHSHISNGPNFSGGSSSGGGSGDGEGLAILCCIALACAAAVCCGVCTHETLHSGESSRVRHAKVATSTITGAASFIVLLWYLISQDILKSELVDNYKWDTSGYRFFLVLIAACGGFLAGGLTASLNNLFKCMPEPEETSLLPAPSPQVAEAIESLGTVEQFLIRGWAPQPNDNPAQCDEFIREVIKFYLKEMAKPSVSAELPEPSAPMLEQANVVRLQAPPGGLSLLGRANSQRNQFNTPLLQSENNESAVRLGLGYQ